MTDLSDPTTVADPPWEPPLAGTEVEHLAAALDRQRTTFGWKAGGLSTPRGYAPEWGPPR